jgi:hypothetical protein
MSNRQQSLSSPTSTRAKATLPAYDDVLALAKAIECLYKMCSISTLKANLIVTVESTIPELTYKIGQYPRFMLQLEPSKPRYSRLASHQSVVLNRYDPFEQIGHRLAFLVTELDKAMRQWKLYPGCESAQAAEQYLNAAQSEIHRWGQHCLHILSTIAQLPQRVHVQGIHMLHLLFLPKYDKNSRLSFHRALFRVDPSCCGSDGYHGFLYHVVYAKNRAANEIANQEYEHDFVDRSSNWLCVEQRLDLQLPDDRFFQMIPITAILPQDVKHLLQAGKRYHAQGTGQCRKWVFQVISRMCSEGRCINPDADLLVYRALKNHKLWIDKISKDEGVKLSKLFDFREAWYEDILAKRGVRLFKLADGIRNSLVKYIESPRPMLGLHEISEARRTELIQLVNKTL